MFGQLVSPEWQCKNHPKEQNGFHARVAEWLLACHLNQKRHLSALVLLPSWPPSSWGSSSKACQQTVVKMAWILLECHHQNSRAEHSYKTVSQGKTLQSHASESCRSKKFQKKKLTCDFPNTSAKQLHCKRLPNRLKQLTLSSFKTKRTVWHMHVHIHPLHRQLLQHTLTILSCRCVIESLHQTWRPQGKQKHNKGCFIRVVIASCAVNSHRSASWN